MDRNLEEGNLEANSYLQNFWEPSVGHKVLFADSEGIDPKECTILEIIQEAPEQVKLYEYPLIIAWAQSLMWKPTLKDALEVIERLGGIIADDCIFFKNKKFQLKKPETLGESVDVIRSLRLWVKTFI